MVAIIMWSIMAIIALMTDVCAFYFFCISFPKIEEKRIDRIFWRVAGAVMTLCIFYLFVYCILKILVELL